MFNYQKVQSPICYSEHLCLHYTVKWREKEKQKEKEKGKGEGERGNKGEKRRKIKEKQVREESKMFLLKLPHTILWL